MDIVEQRALALAAAAEVVAGALGSGRYAGSSDMALTTLKMAEKFDTWIDRGEIPR